MISESFITQLKLACDIESIISSYVPMKREGRNKKALCPFHLEKTPSFVIYEDTQSFYCFGCGAGGDVITFIMRIENLDYIEAVRFLAARVGMTVPEDGQDDRKARLKARILEMNREAARFFHANLKSPAGQAGLRYFAGRRLTKQTVVTYGLGYAPDDWHSLLRHLSSKGYSYEEQEAAALVVKSQKGNYYDQFRNRVMFPIIDLRGNVIGFGGRVLDDSKPKYLNSADTPVFKKSRNLFSLNFAKQAKERTLVLAEGYMDVIAMYQAGVHNVVATLGTALTSEQARLISQYADDVIIAYDSDEPGQIATAKASRLFEEAGVEARVLVLKDAKDPDEYIKKFGAGRFQVLLEQSENVTSSKFKRLKEKYDLELPDEKIKYLGEACGVIAGLYDSLERDVYASTLAAECGLTKEVVLDKVAAIRKSRFGRQKKREWRDIQSGRAAPPDRLNPESAKYPKEAAAEEGIIGFLCKNPDYLEYLLGKIQPGDFPTSWNKRLFELIVDKIQNNLPIELSFFNEQLSPDEMGRFSGILARFRELSNTKQSLDDYIDVLLKHKNRLKDEDRFDLPVDAYEKRRQELLKNKGK
ncbi:MAG: DNA primase [Massilioclostridium sp.]|nr:DNA primase [Massilioclostridium sp.]